MRNSKITIDRYIDNKGFTLVELLAVIALLSLIMGLGVFSIVRVINNIKEEGYKTTINNILDDANNYLIENSGRLFYISSDDNSYEYQCITIQNLIDAGYFDKDVTNSKIAKNRKVEVNDYIYSYKCSDVIDSDSMEDKIIMRELLIIE